LPVPRSTKRALLSGMKMASMGASRPYEILRRAVADQPVFWGGAEAFTETHKKQLLAPRLRRQFSAMTSWQALQPIRQRFEDNAWEKSTLNWMTYVDLNLRLPELLLMRVDKMSMAVSLEGRVPFLDHKFVELAMSIPQAVKTRGGRLKHILKKSVRGIIPDDLIDRKKQGFGVPKEWFTSGVGNYARREISEFCESTDFLDCKEALKVMDGGQQRLSWCLLNFALWWKQYIKEALDLENSLRDLPILEPK
jgi:asparagine synthase (glutamine-hydrolysing)